jgi:hypothetical protein
MVLFLTRLLPGLGGGFNERGVVEYKEYKDDDDEYDDFGRRKKKKGEASAPQQASRPLASPPKAAPKEVVEDEEEDEEAGLEKIRFFFKPSPVGFLVFFWVFWFFFM